MSAETVVAVQFADGEYIAIPTSGHAVAVVTESAVGGFLAVCFCGWCELAPTADEAVAKLDAHIAEVTA